VCEELVRDRDDAAICALRVRELPASPDVERCLELRRELGLPHADDDPGLVAGDGSAIAPDQLRMWLRKARLMSLSLESNAAICRSLLAVRYPERPQEVAP
jgi:hypothetical protein